MCKPPMCLHLSSCFLASGDELLMELSMDLLHKCSYQNRIIHQYEYEHQCWHSIIQILIEILMPVTSTNGRYECY